MTNELQPFFVHEKQIKPYCFGAIAVYEPPISIPFMCNDLAMDKVYYLVVLTIFDHIDYSGLLEVDIPLQTDSSLDRCDSFVDSLAIKQAIAYLDKQIEEYQKNNDT